jgi:hypothetical protein
MTPSDRLQFGRSYDQEEVGNIERQYPKPQSLTPFARFL